MQEMTRRAALRGAAAVSHLDIETVAIRLDTVVSTLQILIETYDRREVTLSAALAGLRDTVADQSALLNEMVKAMCDETVAQRLAGEG